jgi:hypothetical protein
LPVWTPAEPFQRTSPSHPPLPPGEGRGEGKTGAKKADSNAKGSLLAPPHVGEGLVPSRAQAVPGSSASDGRTGDASGARPIPLPLTLSPESITTCSAGQFTVAGVNWAATNPPYTVTLTDETPSTGQSQPNGVVDALGIHGHRIEKTIRMKIDIKDKDGATPPHAVLVNLALAGPSHGTLILDPDGNRIQCSTASFLWHERDAQGNIVALNEELEYQLGTYAPYVGAIPDTQNPSVLKPVWGTAEVLGLVISTVDSTGSNLRQPYSYKVKPEPGKPDHFSVSVPPPPTGTPEAIWTYWADNGKASGVVVNGRTGNGVDVTAANRYYLMDIRENVTFGYTGLQQPVAPGQTISLSVFDQTSGATPTGGAADPNGYGWRITWNDNPAMPSGPYYSALTVNYPADPDWSAGSVSKPLNFQFDRGTFNFVIGVDGWDYLVNPPVAYDPKPPWTVSPGASGDALPKSVDQPDPLYPQTPIDAARFALVLGRGTFTPASPYTVFTGSDPVVETADNPAFRVSLVDSKGVVATDAKFRVHLCPRVDHFPGSGQPRPCTTTPVESSAGMIDSIRINASGPGAVDSQGYAGVELLTAPMTPGTYYIKLETLEGKQYRIRDLSDIGWDRTPTGEYAGAWALVTVVTAELLNEDLQRFDPALNMSIDRVVYVRETDPSETADAYTVDVVMHDEDTQADTTLQNVTLRRLGRSQSFMSDAISVISPDPPLAGLTTLNLEAVEARSPLAARGIRSVAGTLSPTPGRYTVKDARQRASSLVYIPLHKATTRLVEILDATPNFDGVTGGRALDETWSGTGPAPPVRRDRIEARVKWGANGFVAAKLFNVDSEEIFTFDYWNDEPLTTDLRAMGGLLISAEPGLQGEERILPSSGQFRALLGNDTVKPGLYRITAKWGKTAFGASSATVDPFCVTDKPSYAVCDNEWISSVGQRIYLEVEAGAREILPSYLQAVGDARDRDEYLTAIAAAVTDKFAAAGANVVVTTDPTTSHPRLRHLLRQSLGQPGQSPEVYGQTSGAAFPLGKPDADLATQLTDGISLEAAYMGWSHGTAVLWKSFPPMRVSNTAPNVCFSTSDRKVPSNPCPSTILFDRIANMVTHETGHGFGICNAPYLVHGKPATETHLNAVAAGVVGGTYLENPNMPPSAIYLHEPILDAVHGNSTGFGQFSEQSAEWVMQWGMYRWNEQTIDVGSTFDTYVPPNSYLVFDRPLRFSASRDYGKSDMSLARFFRERVPICSDHERRCR